ncbi:MAG: hypothetical protein R6X21_07435 [Candidatus Aminicenantes bacterium]
MGKIRSSLAGWVIIAVLAGCSGTSGNKAGPTTGDIMQEYATESQARADLKEQLARDWKRGSKLVRSGEKQVRAGEKRIAAAERELLRAKEAVKQGYKEISDGTALMLESERMFREKYPDQQLIKKK